MDTPKVDDEGWFWKSGISDKEFPVRILEINTDEYGTTWYFCSYDSDAIGRRTIITRTLDELYRKPKEVVTYQVLSVTEQGCVDVVRQVPDTEVDHYKPWYDYLRSYCLQKTTIVSGKVVDLQIIRQL